MASATQHPNHQLISSEDVEGTEVYDMAGKHIGEVDHLMIDKMSGRVAYGVISFGGFMGLGHNHYPVPWGVLKYHTSLEGYRTDMTEDQLRGAPRFNRNSDWDWSDRSRDRTTHEYYRSPLWYNTPAP